jgi:hypothetical protein
MKQAHRPQQRFNKHPGKKQAPFPFLSATITYFAAFLRSTLFLIP